jgi:hypothetical protein
MAGEAEEASRRDRRVRIQKAGSHQPLPLRPSSWSATIVGPPKSPPSVKPRFDRRAFLSSLIVSASERARETADFEAGANSDGRRW